MRTKYQIMGLMVAFLVLGISNMSIAQWSQAEYCPGWNNPSSFTQGNSQNFYSGASGPDGNKVEPNVTSWRTNNMWSGIDWNTTYSKTQLATVGQPNCSQRGNGTPDYDKIFVIMDATASVPGHPVNRDPNTNDRLPIVPTQFNTNDTSPGFVNTNITKSIRIGDACATGGNLGATALYYNMKVTPQNAMMYIYYACVIESPTHNRDCNPAFVICVTHKNENNQWVPYNDTLAYGIVTGSWLQSEPSYDSNGWHDATSSSGAIKYKDWSKVAINLSGHLYETVRIEVSISDCCASYHFGYAYIAGECREMDVKVKGCPTEEDNPSVATLTVPTGMKKYTWYASQMGVSDPLTKLNVGNDNDYFLFRQLYEGTEEHGAYRYGARPEDFKIRYRPNPDKQLIRLDEDSVGNFQTFKVSMVSALDPSKPFSTDLFVNVQNTKPSMFIDTTKYCDGHVMFINKSEVPGDLSLVVDSITEWFFYNNPSCEGDFLDTLHGDTVYRDYDNSRVQGVKVITHTTDSTCFATEKFPIKPLSSPKGGMTISNRVICDSAETILIDTTSDIIARQWRFLTPEYTGRLDSLVFDSLVGFIELVDGEDDLNRRIERGFNHSIEPVELIVWNGQYSVNPQLTTDTVWCTDTVRDTVAVFIHPELQVTGDTIVCQGSRTNAKVRAVGVDSCYYEWSTGYGTIQGGIPAGDSLHVIPQSDKSVYYVKVTSPQGCVAWDSINTYLVRPKLLMLPADGLICPGDTVMLVGLDADHYSWTASPGDATLAGQNTMDTVYVSPQKSTTYTLVGHGSNDCDALPLTSGVTVVPLPVPKVQLTPEFVDNENPTVVLTDVSSHSVSSEWYFEPNIVSLDRSVEHTFEEASSGQEVEVNVTLKTFNRLGCGVKYPFTIPIYLHTAWLPNMFTPGSADENAVFKMYSINDYEYFHIYIYNRFGELVFESDSPDFVWDGTCNGSGCPQGTYVYVCHYRKPDAKTLGSRNGTVTLIR